MNKNDLRYVKTEELIISTYEELLIKSKKEVSVTQLCKEARINTSTFYTHYVGIEELHIYLCEKRLGEMLDKEPALLYLYENPAQFVLALNDLYKRNGVYLNSIFVNRKGLMVDIIERKLLKLYLDKKMPELTETRIKFCVGGAMRILSENNNNAHVEEVVKLIMKVINN